MHFPHVDIKLVSQALHWMLVSENDQFIFVNPKKNHVQQNQRWHVLLERAFQDTVVDKKKMCWPWRECTQCHSV